MLAGNHLTTVVYSAGLWRSNKNANLALILNTCFENAAFLLCFQSKENEEMRISLADLSNNSSGGGGGGGDDSGDDSELDRDRDGEIWCMQDGRVYEQGEDWEIDSCTSCACWVSVEQIYRCALTIADSVKAWKLILNWCFTKVK